MDSRVTRFLGAFAAVFAAGAGAGYLLAPRPAEKNAPAASVRSAPSAAPRPEIAAVSSSDQARATERHGEDASANLEGGVTGPLQAAARERDFFRRKRDLYDLALQLDADGLAQAMASANQFSVADRDWVQPALLSRWIELDPAGAVGWVRTLPERAQRVYLLKEFFQGLGLKDPPAALRFLGEQQALGGNENLTHSVFDGWAQHDSAGAAQAALTLPREADRNTALYATMRKWTVRAPMEALAWLESSPETKSRASQLSTVLSTWAEQDPQAAAQYALARSGPAKTSAIQAVVRGVAENDPVAAQRLIEQVPEGRARNDILRSLANELGSADPRTAAGFVLAMPPARQGESIYSVANYYARVDVAGALQWAAQLGTAETRRDAQRSIVQRWAQDEPRAAAEYCLAQGSGQEQALSGAVGTWVSRDPQAALAWVRALPDAALRERALTSATSTLSYTDPRRAVEIADGLPPGNAQTNAYSNIARNWARNDPNAAAAWATQLAGTPRHDAVVQGIVQQWADQDPAATGAWLNTVPTGAARDNAVVSFASKVVEADPEGALAWATSIANRDQRENCLRDTFSNWARTDKAAAVAWARRSPVLSEATRTELMRRYP